MGKKSNGEVRPAIDMAPDELRRFGYRAADLLVEHTESLPRTPCRSPVPESVRHALMHQPLPVGPSDADSLLEYIESTIYRYPMGNSSSRFFGWVNSPAAP